MTPKARAGNNRRVKRWRLKNRERYNEYMRRYRSRRNEEFRNEVEKAV